MNTPPVFSYLPFPRHKPELNEKSKGEDKTLRRYEFITGRNGLVSERLRFQAEQPIIGRIVEKLISPNLRFELPLGPKA
jgi:hypothetical protein